MEREDKWKILKSEYIAHRPWMTARCDMVQLPDGRVNPEYWVLEFPDWVNVIALTKDGHMVMVRQYRHALGITEYELCAGVMEEGETPLEAAKRELLEETGGIVQGLSGSPIIQNGKLVGAVTHVLVNDPTKGYGIFIENMLDAAG